METDQEDRRGVSSLQSCIFLLSPISTSSQIDKLVQSRSDRIIIWWAIMVFARYTTHHPSFYPDEYYAAMRIKIHLGNDLYQITAVWFARACYRWSKLVTYYYYNSLLGVFSNWGLRRCPGPLCLFCWYLWDPKQTSVKQRHRMGGNKY